MRNALTTLFLAAVSFTSSAGAQNQELVWVWNERCQEQTTVALEVRFDGKTIYFAQLPVCKWEREFEKGKGSFRFTPARPLVWYGYRSDEGDGSTDPGDTTPAGTELEVDFWQAGGEEDAIDLGYSVAASDGLHMNSLHMLSPTEKSTTTMAPGLVLETQPAKNP
jgi:hypothetical protein